MKYPDGVESDTKRLSVGIDPGRDGALGWISQDRTDIGLLKFTPDNLSAIVDTLTRLSIFYDSVDVYLERVHAMPGQGVTSMFSFGKYYGRVQGILAALDMGYIDVDPQAWQRMMSLGGHQQNRKEAHANKARKLFPDLRKQITQKTGDALLIAEYAWRRTFL